jgi:hypothetical protein
VRELGAESTTRPPERPRKGAVEGEVIEEEAERGSERWHMVGRAVLEDLLNYIVLCHDGMLLSAC